MTKITLTSLANLQNETTAVNAINANDAILVTAIDNTLSRDGTSPNTMLAAIDMNSNQIYNLPAPSTVTSPARLIDVTSNPTITVPGTGTSGHVVPFLDGNNTWSGTNTHSANVTFNSTSTFSGVATMTSPVINSPTMTTPVLGTPISGTLTNAAGLPIATGVSGLAAGVASFLATPTSANLRTAMTDETGTGANVFATTPTLVTPILGVATATSVAATGALTSSSSTAGVGYATGSGGTVSQATNKSTAVSLNALNGTVTMNAAALGASTSVSFSINNTTVANEDFANVCIASGATAGSYQLTVDACAANLIRVHLRNTSAGSLSEAVVIKFMVIKGANS